MKKKVFFAVGPFVGAFLLVALVFLLPFKTTSQANMARAAVSMDKNVITGDSVKNDALATNDYVPFFGSSELSRISPFHPSALAEKYQRDYQPFLLGAPGTQSLSQFMMLQSTGTILKDKKIVFILSPQWFVPRGVKSAYFDAFYSKEQTLDWVLSLTTVGQNEQYVATRLLKHQVVKTDTTLKSALVAIKEGDLPTTLERSRLRLTHQILQKEDALFSQFSLSNRESKVTKAIQRLPRNDNASQLGALADKIGKKQTHGNPFGIQNRFYYTRILWRKAELKNSQVHYDYTKSVEFSDFQVVLAQLAKLHIQALFVIPPVNQKWSDYTGLSQTMLQNYASKITYQLKSQGFTNLADFTNDSNTNYFMSDTIHLGWRGWLAVDQKIKPFLAKQTPAPSYQINPYFLTKKWQQQ